MRFSKYMQDRGRHLGAKHISTSGPKWPIWFNLCQQMEQFFTHNSTLMQLLKYGICTILSSVNCTCMWNYSGSADGVKLLWRTKWSPEPSWYFLLLENMTIWQVTCFGVYTSEGWLESVKARRTFLGSCAKISKTQHQNKELQQMSSQNNEQLSHFLPSGSCSYVHIKRILFQGNIRVSLERSEWENKTSELCKWKQNS